ncbi:hypothetical protein B0I08_10339 [Glaciihabitans tibetensis]|uniref:Type III secretion system (T3SS) SseB-like protein n=1 Tax=Glaciihabitans tibetensis TaxID=1266600 RepID=A0A2T0VFK2_9MICO|nr:hypothetical protein [Glaciihabitans tibetensis]PRY68834.1 hypothetical protein B0I08_10339 [Glaciihabitans tibetensis]
MARQRRDPTALETAIQQARDGVMSEDILMLILAGSTVIVPSGREPLNSVTEVRPVLIPNPTGLRLAVFTHADFVGGIPRSSRYQVDMEVSVLLQLIPADTGITVNPRSMTTSLDMAPGAVQALRELFAGAS